ncbi:MAG: mechanosensitive ion channel [Magnetococcus sp. DMHC-1]
MIGRYSAGNVPGVRLHQTPNQSCLLFVWLAWWGILGLAGMTPVPALADTPAPPLHEMENNVLLEKTSSLLDAAEAVIKNQKRALSANQIQIQKVQRQQEKPLPESTPTGSGDVSTPGEIQKQVTLHNSRMEAIRLNLAQAEVELALWNQRLKLIETIQTAIHSWENNLDQINLLILEIQWRIQDGTLTKSPVSQRLQADFIHKRRQQYQNLRQTWQKEIEQIQGFQTRLRNNLAALNKDRSDTEVHLDLLNKQLQQTQKTTQYKETLQRQSPEQWVANYRSLHAENEQEVGSFYIKSNQFNRLLEQIREKQEVLDKPGPAELEDVSQDSLLFDEARAQSHAEQMNVRIQAYQEEIQLLEAQQQQQNRLLQIGDALGTQNTNLNSQFSRLSTLAGLLENPEIQKKMPDFKVQKNTQQIRKSAEEMTRLVSEALTATENVRQQQAKLSRQLQKSREALQVIQNKKNDLGKAMQLASQRKGQEERFQEMDAKILLDLVQKSIRSLADTQKKIEEGQEVLKQTQARVTGIQFKLQSTKDPLFVLVREKMEGRRQEIREQLYGMAELPAPAEAKKEALPATTTAATTTMDPTELLAKWGDRETQQLHGLPEELSTYHNLIASHIQYLEVNKQRQGELAEAAQQELVILADHIDKLNAALLYAQQSLYGAMEIQRRLGRGEIKPEQLPENLSLLMDRSLPAKLQKSLSQVTSRKSAVEQIRAGIQAREPSPGTDSPGKPQEKSATPAEKAEPAPDDLQQQLSGIMSIIGSKLRIISDREKYREKFNQSLESWSETEKKNLHQEAIRHLKDSETLQEKLFGAFASERGQSLTEILLGFHEKVLNLKGQLKNLGTQQEDMERLLRLTEKENPLLLQLQPLLKLAVQELEQQLAVQQATLHMQLAPKKAGEIQKQLEKNLGIQLPLPQAVDDKLRQSLLDQGVETLFEISVNLIASQKRIVLFDNRRGRFGIQNELAVYQEENGKLKALSQNAQQELYRYTGQPLKQINQLQTMEGTTLTESEIRELQLGKIGKIQADRLQEQEMAAIWALLKFAGIYMTAFFLVRLIQVMVWVPMQEKAGRPIPNLIRGMVAFLIYTSAFFMIVAFVFGQTLTGLLATSGILAMVIGLAVQINISNIFSGLAINLEQPFKVGDWIQVDNIVGKVTNMTWRSTHLFDPSWERSYTIPNHVIAQSKVLNFHAPSDLFKVGGILHLSQDLEPLSTEKLLLEALQKIPNSIKPAADFIGFSDTGADYKISCLGHDYSTRNRLTRQLWLEIWKVLAANDIKPVERPVAPVVPGTPGKGS